MTTDQFQGGSSSVKIHSPTCVTEMMTLKLHDYWLQGQYKKLVLVQHASNMELEIKMWSDS